MLTKEQKLELALKAKQALKKQYGNESIRSMSDLPENIEVISTGSIGLDEALGIGGIPRGRVVEIYGDYSSGKTTLCKHIIANAQKNGGLCAVVDAEHSLDPEYAKSLGVNVNELDISQPSSGEEGLDVAEKLIGSGAYDLVIVDSTAALVPLAELEADMDNQKMGLHAKLMSKALKRIVPLAYKTNTAVIFTNQIRQKMVLMGNPNTTPGGLAMGFYASIRMEISRSLTTDNSVFDSNKEKVGNLHTVKVLKNKLAPPFKSASFDIIYGVGIDKIEEIIRIGNDKGVLKKWGNTVTFNDTKYDLGEFGQLVRDNDEFYEDLKNKLCIKKEIVPNVEETV